MGSRFRSFRRSNFTRLVCQLHLDDQRWYPRRYDYYSIGQQAVSHDPSVLLTGSMDQIKKKNKAAPVKPFQVKNYMWIFVNALIENPAFDSQTKDTLTLKSSAFGSKCELSEDFVKKGMSARVEPRREGQN